MAPPWECPHCSRKVYTKTSAQYHPCSTVTDPIPARLEKLIRIANEIVSNGELNREGGKVFDFIWNHSSSEMGAYSTMHLIQRVAELSRKCDGTFVQYRDLVKEGKHDPQG